MKKLITMSTLIFTSFVALAGDDLMAKLDTDKDRRISVEEAAVDASLSALFAELDLNNDGYLTSDELKN